MARTIIRRETMKRIMDTLTETRARWLFLACTALSLVATGCKAPTAETTSSSGTRWAVTAWGAEHEVFPLIDPLIAGEISAAQARVTRLDGFTPLAEGELEIVLVGPSGEQSFGSAEAVRPGVFDIAIQPTTAEEADLLFRVTSGDLTEEIPGGKVRIGAGAEPGGLLVARVPKGAIGGGEPLSFSKEEQWRSDFATNWVRTVPLTRSVEGVAKIRPHASGEAVVTAPVDGVVRSVSGAWPFGGRETERGAALFLLASSTRGNTTLRAPISGTVSTVSVSPGSTVRAGESIARIVQSDPLWLEVALRPADARQLSAAEAAGVIVTDGENPPIRIEEGVQLVSIAPEASSRTGTVSALLEVPSHPELTLGTRVQAKILLSDQVLQSEEGTVVPSTALVDDGGVSVVYLQLSGESFVRQEVDILERQGEQVVVSGLAPGQRLVSRGGESIRRSSLMTSGQAHGHVH